MHKPIAIHPITGPVEGPVTRSLYVTRLAELIREETGVAWEYACRDAERAFSDLCNLNR
jgi:hypothetical protein